MRSLVLFVALLASCAGATPAARTTKPLPPLVDVTLLGVTVAPFKADGMAWDAAIRLPPALVGRLARAAGAPPTTASTAELAAVLVDPLVVALQKPEVKGTASRVESGRAGETHRLVALHGTFSPAWAVPQTFAKLPTDGRVTLRLTLLDDDVFVDDQMGAFSLDVTDFARAYDEGMPVDIAVGSRTGGQVLFAKIRVEAARLSLCRWRQRPSFREDRPP